MLLDDPGYVRGQILRVVCQIQWFDFESILVVSRKVIIRIPPVLGLKSRARAPRGRHALVPYKHRDPSKKA